MLDVEAIDIVCLDTAKKLNVVKGDVQSLFGEVFHKPLTDKAWEHYYINAPDGNAVSFICHWEGKLVAHGGIIPQKLIAKDGSVQSYFLQTAVMVASKFRTLHVFKKLMDAIHAFVEGQRSFVLAYPNDQSYSPFIKLMQWNQIREYVIRQYALADRGQATPPQAAEQKEDYKYRLILDEAFLRWRGELNGMKVYGSAGQQMIYKDYVGSLEILDLQGEGFALKDIAEELGYETVNIPDCFLPYCSLNGLKFGHDVGSRQRMCVYWGVFKTINCQSIKPSLLLSDVF